MKKGIHAGTMLALTGTPFKFAVVRTDAHARYYLKELGATEASSITESTLKILLDNKTLELVK